MVDVHQERADQADEQQDEQQNHPRRQIGVARHVSADGFQTRPLRPRNALSDLDERRRGHVRCCSGRPRRLGRSRSPSVRPCQVLLWYAMRGSSKGYTRSINSVARLIARMIMKTMPYSRKKSEPEIALTRSEPMPGKPNTTSTITEPDTIWPRAMASEVNCGRIALRTA